MASILSLIEAYPEIDKSILKQYQLPERVVTVNADDMDLQPIDIDIEKLIRKNFQMMHPDMEFPEEDLLLGYDHKQWHKIQNFGLPAREQKWSPPKMPDRLKKLERTCETLDEIYQIINDNKELYGQEIKWMRSMWHKRLYGHWVFINGVPTYIDGWHFFYCGFWELDIGLPEYRSRDRKFFLFARYCYTTTEAPFKFRRKVGNNYQYTSDKKDFLQWQKDYEDNGRSKPEASKEFFWREYNTRTCYGFNYPKHRREGATFKGECINYELVSRSINGKAGIQSLDDTHGKAAFLDKLVAPWKSLPFFFKPKFSGSTNPKSELIFEEPTRKSKNKGTMNVIKTGLGSKINFATTAHRSFYDGDKLLSIHTDEEGKCFGPGTELLMYDGSIKQAQDIFEGDVLMGPDSTPRIVNTTTFGKEEMYEIIPNKGLPWTCNASHIIVAVVCSAVCGYRKGEIIKFTVKEYLNFTPWLKQHLNLYRVPVQYPERETGIDPYLIGVWLGDGTSRSSQITNVEKEVQRYINTYAGREGQIVRSKGIGGITHSINPGIYKVKIKVTDLSSGEEEIFDSIREAGKKYGKGYIINWMGRENLIHKIERVSKSKNPLLEELNFHGMIQNKHIPDPYLINSEEKRFRLLAGLIDSDGHKTSGKESYEITQKNKTLAYQIQRLATELGLYSSINVKVATLKREGKATYECEVYRVKIYGDRCPMIPCYVERKKCHFKIHHDKKRDSLKTGFKVKYLGIGDYYGFSLKGEDRTFLLKDCTVVHNTILEKVDERWEVIRQCLSMGNGKKIVGFNISTSTVGEMTKQGGTAYFRLCKDSHWQNRIPESGQTSSGKLNLFIPAFDGLEGFVDEYGNSIIDDPKTPIRTIDGKMTDIGAKTYLKARAKDLLGEGKPENIEKYHENMRLHPTKFKECFMASSSDTGFNIKILSERINDLQMNERLQPVMGDFRWKVYRESVEWIPNPYGKFSNSLILPEGEANRIRAIDGVKCPANPNRFVSSADAFRFEKTQHRRMSNGGGAVFYRRDYTVDPEGKDPIIFDETGAPVDNWKSHRFCCTYNNRVATKKEYVEDMLMMCIYYGAMMYPEMNVPEVNDRFIEWGFGGYLLYDYDPIHNQYKENPGFSTVGNVKQDLFGGVKEYIEVHGYRERHLGFLEECLEIKGLEEMTDFDLFTAGAGCLRGLKSQYSDYINNMLGNNTENQNTVDFANIMLN